MPIFVSCACGKQLKATDAAAGKRGKCPACGAVLHVPAPEEPAVEVYGLAPEPEPRQPSPPPVPSAARAESPTRPVRPSARADVPRPRPVRKSPAADQPPSRMHLHWLLVLALIPLGISLLQKDEDQADLGERLGRTLENAPAEVRGRLEQLGKSGREVSLDDVLTALPGERLAGAHLPRRTWVHWGYAALSACLFAGFLLLVCSPRDANPLGLYGIGVFTATAGILLLLAVQFLAAATEGRWITGRGIVMIFFYLAKFIGFSYRSALDPDSNFFLSFFGFTFGVGFCEELCKALPLLWHFRRRPTLGWRGAFLWGLTSGVGFGVAEGIMYASHYYNGISPAGTYLVRFISCVALHALWSGSVGITLYKCQELIQGDMSWYEFIPPLVRILGVAMVLHGLYDTLLKKDQHALALCVAVASFGWLAWQIAHTGATEEEGSPATAAA